ncbi:MAG: 5-oxoprolinase subunit PxpB [Pseudomonadota bacterium]
MSPLYEKPRIRFAGDRGILVEYGDSIADDINLKVLSVTHSLDHEPIEGVIEVVPSYRSLLILYDPCVVDVGRLIEALNRVEFRAARLIRPEPRLIEIPVCYGGVFGPDMGVVAALHGLPVEDVVRIHSSVDYRIHMIGFTPGFPFLGGLPDAIHTPRLEAPRRLVPAGSVGIANNQTGIYPVDSPGGWRIIGRTPLKLFRPERADPFLYRTGDLIRFVSIDLDEYQLLVEEE